MRGIREAAERGLAQMEADAAAGDPPYYPHMYVLSYLLHEADDAEWIEGVFERIDRVARVARTARDMRREVAG
jgi:hypothetical protein